MPDRPTVRYTYQDYVAIPDSTPYRRHEIVDGELHVTEPDVIFVSHDRLEEVFRS